MINAQADLWFDIEGLDLVDDDGHPCKDGRLPKHSVNVTVDLKVEDIMKERKYQLHDKLLREMFPRATSVYLYLYEEKENKYND